MSLIIHREERAGRGIYRYVHIIQRSRICPRELITPLVNAVNRTTHTSVTPVKTTTQFDLEDAAPPALRLALCHRTGAMFINMASKEGRADSRK